MRPQILIAVLVTVAILLSGCGGDKNHVTIGEQTYELDRGYVDNWGENLGEGQSGYDIDIWLLSPGVDPQGRSGDGAIVFLDLNTDAADLSAGEYAYSGSRRAGEVFSASITIGDLSADRPDAEYEIAGGTVAVARDDGRYTVTFDLSAEDGTPITGAYTGPLTDPSF